jgi:hypothetical protein
VSVRSVIVKFGIYDADSISVALELPHLVLPVWYRTSIEIDGVAESSNPGDVLGILVMVDDRAGAIKFAQTPVFPSGAPFHFDFVPADYAVPEGEHLITFFAVNGEGSVSEGQEWKITVVEPTPSPADSPAATALPSQGQSPSDAAPSANGVLIGVAVGSSLIVIAVAVTPVVLFVWRRRKKQFKIIHFTAPDSALNEKLTSDTAEELL